MKAQAQRVLITGASGFVGAAVTHRLVAEDRRVAILLRPNSDVWRIIGLIKDVSIVWGDLTDMGSAMGPLCAFQPDAVVHLAWDGVKGDDRNTFAQVSNVGGSLSLYEAARRAGVERFVGLGSQAEYGPCSSKVNEDMPTRPTTLYGAAKLATLLLLERTAAADGVSLAWLRLFSAYGPKDDPSWLIPYVTLSLLAGRRPALTSAEQMWDFTFVDDVAAAIISVLDSGIAGVFNVGSGDARSLRDVIIAIRDLIDPNIPLGFGEIPYRVDQVMHLQADIGALTAKVGWHPRVSLERGLEATVDWYRHGRSDHEFNR